MKRRAVFLDRDGTIISLFGGTGYLTREQDMRLLPGAGKAIAELQKAGYLIIVHTNQANIARGILNEATLQHLHSVLQKRLQRYGAHIDAMYYCPHHPDGVVKTYRKKCACRKPKPGLLRRAIKKFDIDPTKSFLVGDSSKDILAGQRAGLVSILVKTGNKGKEKGAPPVTPDVVVNNLLTAARYIKKHRA